MFKVELDKIKKELKRIPHHVAIKLQSWARDVEKFGLPKIRQVKGYHDEPLKGKRTGQRSIRLSKSYRAIYTTSKSGIVTIVCVEEVSKHEY